MYKETAVCVFSEIAVSQERICFKIYASNFARRFRILVEMYNVCNPWIESNPLMKATGYQVLLSVLFVM